MPLIKEEDLGKQSLLVAQPLTEPAITPTMRAVVDIDHETTIVDLKWQPRTNLLTHIEGASWVVEYFSQVITKDSALSGVEATGSPTLQSYTLIRQLELKVSSALSTSQDDQTKAMMVGGSAIVLPVLIANVGDMFIAPIGEGRSGVFRIISSIKKSIFKESCYEIGYVLDGDGSTKRDALLARVVQTYYYLKNYLSFGKNPLISSQVYATASQLQLKFRRVMNEYVSKYTSKKTSAFLVGGQAGSYTYDHLHTRFMLNVFSQQDCLDLAKVKMLSAQDDPMLYQKSIWDAVANQDELQLNTIFKRYALMDAYMFSNDPMLRSLHYSGVSRVVYPYDPLMKVDEQVAYIPKVPYGDRLVSSMAAIPLPYDPTTAGDIGGLRGVNLSSFGVLTAPVIYPVTQDDYYVFSEHFYADDTQMSVLETMAIAFIRRQPTDVIQLSEMLNICTSWGELEQYYYIPLLLVMTKQVIYGAS